jgi:polyhydroxybutyrate depolymerase
MTNYHEPAVETIDVDGLQRSYLIHLPSSPVGKALIIALHPLGSNPKLMEAMTGFSTLADENQIIVAYPEGTKASDTGTSSWNAKFCCQDAWYGKVDDIGFLSTLIDSLAARYVVKGILVTGFSNGGMLAHLAGIELSDRITAIAPVAATVGRGIADLFPKAPLPVLMVHGSDDALVPYDQRSDDRFLPTAGAVDYWVRVNDCDPMPEVRTGQVVRMRYAPRNGEAEVVLLKVGSAGHVWPGSRVRMRYENDPRTLDASAAIWEFFRAHI